LPAKSVAFTGMEGSARVDGNWDITYNFEHRPDNDGQSIKTKKADGTEQIITVPATDGWDYVWAGWDKFAKADGEANETTRVIKAVHVVKDMYETSDFNSLGMVGV
jgi:hypothetical protein